jgi:hypothetical protein
MSDTLIVERIQISLTRLRLPRMAEILESVMQAAQEGARAICPFSMLFWKRRLAAGNSVGWRHP